MKVSAKSWVVLEFLALIGGVFLDNPAWAQGGPRSLSPIVDRNYKLDLYQGVVFGSPRLVAMGGAAFAVGEGASGLFTNPASAAVRSSTQTESFNFSAFFNSYVPQSGVDLNNNGDYTTQYRQAAVYAPGVLAQFGLWGLGLNLGYSRYEIAPQAGGGLGVRTIFPHLAVARRFLDNRLVIGGGLRGALLNMYTSESSQGLFTRSGVSGEFGSVWQPRDFNFRLALAAALPVYSGTVDSSCDPNNCYGYILPSQAISPWVAILGTGWRFARSQWNKPVEAHYHDELQVTLGLDLLIAGSVDNAFGVEKFAAKQLQPSGRRLSASPRFGAEAEVWPGWVRFRGGTYWEPARYVGISGRIHATVGGEFRIYEFHIGKSPYRLALSLSGDFSTHYKNAGASLGLWD